MQNLFYETKDSCKQCLITATLPLCSTQARAFALSVPLFVSQLFLALFRAGKTAHIGSLLLRSIFILEIILCTPISWYLYHDVSFFMCESPVLQILVCTGQYHMNHNIWLRCNISRWFPVYLFFYILTDFNLIMTENKPVSFHIS